MKNDLKKTFSKTEVHRFGKMKLVCFLKLKFFIPDKIELSQILFWRIMKKQKNFGKTDVLNKIWKDKMTSALTT